MTQRIRLWKVAEGAVPEEIPNSGVGLEKRLEDWLARDISMLDPNLLVVGRQVPTAFGGFIDLLCIDREGFLVVVELKQGQTPREVTAQALDYASWAKDLNTDDIEEIAEKYLKMEGSLEEALEEKSERCPMLCARVTVPSSLPRRSTTAPNGSFAIFRNCVCRSTSRECMPSRTPPGKRCWPRCS